MKVDLRGRAGELFLEALQREEQHRDDFLVEACAGDEALLAQVRHLLAHHRDEDLLAKRDESKLPIAAPDRKLGAEPIETGALVSRLCGTRRSRAIFLTVVVAVVAGLGWWARHGILVTWDTQLRENLLRRVQLETAHVEEWVRGQLLDVQSACNDPDLIELAGRLSRQGTDLNLTLEQRHAELTADGVQDEVHAALEHILRREDLEGYALIHRSGVLLAAMNRQFVGEQLGSDEVARDGAWFSLPSNPESWAGARSRLREDLVDLEAMAWVEAPVVFGEAKPDGRRPVLVRLVVGSPAREFSRILSTGNGGAESTSETYAVDRQGFLRSENRYGRSHVEALRARGIEPVWSKGLAVHDATGTRIMCFALIDPGAPVDRLAPGSALPGNRRTRIFEDVTERVLLGDRASADFGVRMEPYRDYRGVQVVGAWAWLDDFDFALVTEVDAAEAFAARRYVDLILLLVLALLGGILLFGLSSSFAVVRLRRRVEEGTQLGPYTLVKRIGEGGLGEVYLARHALLRRPTAVKLLKPEVIDAESLARFEREVQLASQLTSPSTIAVYDFGKTLEGTFYCAMEYLDGMNLYQVVRASGDLDPARVVHVLRGACASLGEAHARGLVHRDVKPMNLMLCIQGGRHDVVKLLDFGLVKEVGDAHGRQLTRPTRISGTLLYLAPERLRAPDRVDARTDIYSLGAVAYFLLTGKHHLSGGTDADLLDRILRQAPSPPSRATDQPIPEALDRLVLACLAKEMDERPVDTAAVIAVLDAIEGLEPWTEERAASWWRAHRG